MDLEAGAGLDAMAGDRELALGTWVEGEQL